MEGPTVFDDHDEELDAVAHCRGFESGGRSSDLWVFQYGLRYIPTAGENNLYRTVKIEQLPGSVTLNHIFPKFHGEVYSSSIFNTSPIIGSNTAIVTFVWQSDALEFVYSTPESGLRIGPVRVIPTLVHTPTYPMSAEMKMLVLRLGHTRCLAISPPASKVDRLNRFLDRFLERLNVESRKENEAGEVCVRFHSIKMASTMQTILSRSSTLGDCEVRFYSASRASSETAA